MWWICSKRLIYIIFNVYLHIKIITHLVNNESNVQTQDYKLLKWQKRIKLDRFFTTKLIFLQLFFQKILSTYVPNSVHSNLVLTFHKCEVIKVMLIYYAAKANWFILNSAEKLHKLFWAMKASDVSALNCKMIGFKW